VDAGAALALDRLAQHHKMTKREVLERVLLEAYGKLVKGGD
jgi:hypothetical protein